MSTLAAGWRDLWDQVKDIWDANPGYIIGALALQTGQTVFAGLSYYGILRYAYPGKVDVHGRCIASYAVGVAMNNFLPANIGTFVTLLMFVAIIRAARSAERSRRISCRRSSSSSPGRSSTSTCF